MKFLSEVCKDVSVEPMLHSLTGEALDGKTSNKKDEARLDIGARGFWISGQKAFFDVFLALSLEGTEIQKSPMHAN